MPNSSNTSGLQEGGKWHGMVVQVNTAVATAMAGGVEAHEVSSSSSPPPSTYARSSVNTPSRGTVAHSFSPSFLHSVIPSFLPSFNHSFIHSWQQHMTCYNTSPKTKHTANASRAHLPASWSYRSIFLCRYLT
jgi:hypothetical protein